MTGNGWVANGILRVLSALENSDFEDQYKNEISDLTEWTREILISAWQQPMVCVPIYSSHSLPLPKSPTHAQSRTFYLYSVMDYFTTI